MAKFRIVVAEGEASEESLRAILASLQIVQSPESAPTPIPAPASATTAKRIAAPAKIAESPYEVRPGSLGEAALVALKAGPLSSIDVFERLQKQNPKTSAGSVYGVLRFLTEKGKLRKLVDEHGTRWALQ